MEQAWINFIYLIASLLFILGLKGLTHPRTAVRGNLTGALGMLLAVVATLLHRDILSFWTIILAALIGGGIGAYMAIKVKMTQMPQLVALFNGFGGGASVFVAGAELIAQGRFDYADSSLQTLIATAAAVLIGAVTFWGSLVAYGKLEELKRFKDSLRFPGQQLVNAVLFLLALLVGAAMVSSPSFFWLLLLTLIASVLGVLLVMPIGGADMPVVIALLNSYSGLAACATGFVLQNNVLIIAGSLVGASGVILTNIMCKAMNRSLTHVLFGVLGPTEDTPDADDVYAGKIKSAGAEEIAMILETASRVVIVPGYGMAVAQAQHAVRDLANLLEARGTTVEYAIHPVAGRMPGHMNVLLAEADVPYEKLKEIDEINMGIEQVDVCIVIGANDVVNPLARTDPNSPIAGMPIIDVDKARTVVVIKRSLSPGYAGIKNPLFAMDNTLMFFNDGKKAMLELIAAMKEL